MRFEIVIANTGAVMATSDDKMEALRMADARTKADRILHTIIDHEPPDMSVLAMIFEPTG